VERELDPELAETIERGDERSLADELLDDLMPPELDWKGVVRRHPIPAVLVAAAAGYWLGRSRKSQALVDALTGALAATMVARVGSLGVAGLGDFEDEDEVFGGFEDPYGGRG
jgi:hypothetical protein